jgi:hypothetical protein
MLADDVALAQLDGNQLPQERNAQVTRFVQVFVHACVRCDERVQFTVGRVVERGEQFSLFGGRRTRQDGSRNPDAGRNHLRLLQPVNGRPVRRAIHAAPCAIHRVLIVQAADGDAGWGARGRQHGMSRMQPGVADSADNC